MGGRGKLRGGGVAGVEQVYIGNWGGMVGENRR